MEDFATLGPSTALKFEKRLRVTHVVRKSIDLQKMILINSLYGMGSPLWSSAEETEKRKLPLSWSNMIFREKQTIE